MLLTTPSGPSAESCVSADSVGFCLFHASIQSFCTSQGFSGRPVFASDGFIARTGLGRAHTLPKFCI